MDHTLITSSNLKTTSWPGGTTTELFIFPRMVEYKLRNFDFRISTATVDKDTSEFTILPGFSRKLMVFDGFTTLSHEGRYSILLNKFDTDEFEGDWKTSSVGKCRDFNLMKKTNLQGT